MGEVILLAQTLHPFKGRLRIEHDGKNVSIDTIKVVIKIKLTVTKKTQHFFVIQSKTYIPFFAQSTSRSAGTPHLLRHTSQKPCLALSHV
jgi:hypothetical protein